MEDLKQDLSRRFSKSDSGTANFFLKEGVVAERIPTPFLVDGGIARVIDRGVRVVRPFYVGFAGMDFVVELAGNREGFRQLCLSAKFNPESDANRVAFLRTLLQTTPVQPSRFFLLSNAEEIRARPQMTREEEASFAQFTARYRGVIRAPAMQAKGNGWIGEAFGLLDVALVRYEVKLEQNGAFQVDEKVLERNLPIPMVIH